MSPQQFRDISYNGLWKQNAGLAQLLGLCPILAISTSMVNAVSLGLVWVLAVLGAIRELLGAGTLFSGIEMIFPSLSAWNVFGEDYPGFLIAILPPGAFFALGCLIAAFNAINTHLAARTHKRPPAAATTTSQTTPAERAEPAEPAPAG